MTVFIGATVHAQFSLLTEDFHRLTDKDIAEMVRELTTVDRPRLGRRRP